MSKFTPGPWVVFNSAHDEQEIVGVTSQADEHIDSDGDGADICEMANAGYLGQEQVEANARLIAAAPDLYEALKALLHEVNEAGLGTAKDYGWPNALNKTRAALSKVSHV